ncbi:hypothetical protein OSTOST_03432 [Ostertagia ostertagi]
MEVRFWWRWKGKKKSTQGPEAHENDNQQGPHDTSEEVLFDRVVKQEEPGPSQDPDQGDSELKMADEERSEDLSDSNEKKTEQRQKVTGSRRTRANETLEERAERRRFKAERERIRRRQNRLRREREREVANNAFKLEEARPSCAELTSMKSHSIAGGVLQAVKAQVPHVKAQVPQGEPVSPIGKGKAACFALVGFRSEEERQRFSALAMSNGFRDLIYLSGPLVEPSNNALKTDRPSELNRPSVVSHLQESLSENVTSPPKMETDDRPGTSATTVADGISMLSVLIAKDESVTSEDNFEQQCYTEEREFRYFLFFMVYSVSLNVRCSSQSSEIGQVSPRIEDEDAQQQSKNSCSICGSEVLTKEIRKSLSQRRQTVVLLACLLAQNMIKVEEAKKICKEAQESSVLICQDHYIQAAEYVRKEVELMCGKFPENGFHSVPTNVRDGLLSFVRVYASRFDENNTLTSDDVSCCLNKFLVEYLRKDESSMDVENSTKSHEPREEEQQPSTTEQSPVNQQQPSVSTCADQALCSPRNASSTGVAAEDVAVNDEVSLIKLKKENSCEISAMDLLESASQETDPVIIIGSTSPDSKASISTSPSESIHKEEVTKRNNDKREIITVPSAVLRDQAMLADTLNDDHFWNYFRITRKTFTMLCYTLEKILKRKGDKTISCSTTIKLATTLEVLAGNAPSSVGFTAAHVTRIFNDVLAALAEWSTTMVQWPNERERKKISANFFELTGLHNIVGCIDGTIVRGIQGLNIGVVVDDKKRFRWVFAKYHSNEDDDSVFKQSSLCQQLRDGRRKGFLIGDDAYKSERFLLTPSEGKDWMTEEDFALANTLRSAHLLVQEAIKNWKRQFPILNGTIRSQRIARIVICCAALYNLSRAEGEPLFEVEDEVVVDEPKECLTIIE